ncbi:HEAT repeat domain-containing protein [Bacteroidota bacterium]
MRFTIWLGMPEYRVILQEMRHVLLRWMDETKDLGLIPEPECEELGKRYGSKYAILSQMENRDLISQIVKTIEASEKGDMNTLHKALDHSQASVRYWAAVWLGNIGEKSDIEILKKKVNDPSGMVRVGIAEALCKLGNINLGRDILVRELEHMNHAVQLYAIHALEGLGNEVQPVLSSIRKAKDGQYEYVCRVANRILINNNH